MNDKTFAEFRLLFPSIEEQKARAQELQRREFDHWQQIECQRYGLTHEQHDKIIELAGRLQSAAPWLDAYDAIVSMINPPSPLSKLGLTLE